MILFFIQSGGDPPPPPIATLVIVAELVLTLDNPILSIELDTI